MPAVNFNIIRSVVMKSLLLVAVLGCGLAGCQGLNWETKTLADVEVVEGVNYQHKRTTFDTYPACVGSCWKQRQGN